MTNTTDTLNWSHYTKNEREEQRNGYIYATTSF